jgi:ketosteroid isomerase-like protein
MAYGVFIERWWGQFTSRSEPTELMIRATLIFRREDGVWKAVHRHGDNAVEKAPPS